MVEILCTQLDDEEMQMFADVARQIWLRQNKVVFGGDFCIRILYWPRNSLFD
jgi:hypothetical protein